MKAMIFAAGRGTRLKPITDKTPKALVSVGGKPLLQHTIEKLKHSGFNEIIINVHHFADQIIEFVLSNNSFNINIEFSEESELLDTGGGIKKASYFFNDSKPFLVHNVDVLSNINLNELYLFHKKSNSVATLACSPRQTSRYLLFNENNILKGWINKSNGQTKSAVPNFNPVNYKELAFSGIHVLNPSILKEMDKFPDKFSIIDFYLSLCNHKPINAFIPSESRMIDVGKPESLKEANNFLQ
jgi:NDP-sugar pyrophosphorylase family protein